MGASACNATSPRASAGSLIAVLPAWLRGALALQDVFQVDFVVMDEGGGAVDNNRGQDFRLPLVEALTEEGILQRQAAAMAQLEERRLQVGPPLPKAAVLHYAQSAWQPTVYRACKTNGRGSVAWGQPIDILPPSTTAICHCLPSLVAQRFALAVS